jgi:diguanylate cyclase (GGDEF)-like protein
MGPVRRVREGSLLLRFGVLGLLLTVGVGFVLAYVLTGTIEDRAQTQAEATVVGTVRLGFQPQLTPYDLAGGFERGRFADVDRVVDRAGDNMRDGRVLDDLDPVAVKIFNRDRTIVWASDESLVGDVSSSAQLGRALTGDVVSEFTSLPDDSAASDSGETQLLEVYVPIRYEGWSAPSGAVEIYLPYGPVAAAVASDVRTMILTLVACLTVFYAALIRFVARADRRLRRQTAELQDSADRNRHQATHDALTGLPNRVLLRDRIEQALAGATRTSAEVAVLLIDLDRFKEINDTLGHTYGDELLRQIGPRLESVLRDGDTVARLGGDEFAVLLPVVEGADEARAVAERLRESLHRRFEVQGVALDLEASVGIALSPWHGTDVEELLRNADIAMYVAKEVKAGAVLFCPDEHVTGRTRLTVLGDLRTALDSGDELFLHYQPKVTLDGERVEGLEALLRWQHPERGMIPPSDFIPVAEGTGIIIRLTERVLGMALGTMRGWLDQQLAVPVAVNLSARCLLDASLPDLVARLLDEHRVPASLLRLEVTESAVMSDAARCMDVLQRLHELCVRLSIDDFGTGYSSMVHLRRLPVDELKIDRSFVLGMTTMAADAVLVRTAIDLGHNLGLTVVAEGVEALEHADALRDLGCDVAQGYHYARPMGVADMTALLQRSVLVRDPLTPLA